MRYKFFPCEKIMAGCKLTNHLCIVATNNRLNEWEPFNLLLPKNALINVLLSINRSNLWVGSKTSHPIDFILWISSEVISASNIVISCVTSCCQREQIFCTTVRVMQAVSNPIVTKQKQLEAMKSFILTKDMYLIPEYCYIHALYLLHQPTSSIFVFLLQWLLLLRVQNNRRFVVHRVGKQHMQLLVLLVYSWLEPIKIFIYPTSTCVCPL